MKESSAAKLEPRITQPKPILLGKQLKQDQPKSRVTYILVPLMLFASSAIMATAWLGHLRFKEDVSFLMATFFAWLLVLPEYALNIKALRLGYRSFSAGQMGAFRLCTGVFCIAFVSHYMLGEQLTNQKLLGFGVIIFAMILVSDSSNSGLKPGEEQ